MNFEMWRQKLTAWVEPLCSITPCEQLRKNQELEKKKRHPTLRTSRLCSGRVSCGGSVQVVSPPYRITWIGNPQKTMSWPADLRMRTMPTSTAGASFFLKHSALGRGPWSSIQKGWPCRHGHATGGAEDSPTPKAPGRGLILNCTHSTTSKRPSWHMEESR